MMRGDTSRKPKAAWIRSLIPSTPSCTIRQSIGVTVSFRPSPKIPLQLTHQLYPKILLPCLARPATRDIEKIPRRTLDQPNVLASIKTRTSKLPNLVENVRLPFFPAKYTTYVPGRKLSNLSVFYVCGFDAL